jgi:hypothetical protein
MSTGLLLPFRQKVAAGVLAVALVLLLGGAYYVGAYFLAMHEDDVCFAARSGPALDRRAVEACLFLYTESACNVADRIPDVDYARGACVSYNVLGLDPIQVIYDRHGRVLTAVSAYE